MKFVSWHPVLTDHQSFTVAALAEAAGSAPTIYVANITHAERQAQGWVSKHALSLRPQLIPKHGWLSFALGALRKHRDAVHIFSGPFENIKQTLTLIMALMLGLRVYLISEPYSSAPIGHLNDKRPWINRLKSKLRPLLYSMYGLLLRRRLRGVFAISPRAVAQYAQIGIPAERIFPFGYFVPYQDTVDTATAPVAGPAATRIIFVGSLIKTKGLDLLITAVEHINSCGGAVTIDVYGPGDTQNFRFDNEKVRYCGVIPFGCAQRQIAQYDILVLPSRYDGWGVVVNEALMAGVPVVCSGQVGAGAVVEKWKCGVTFASENVGDLVSKLQRSMIPENLRNMRTAAVTAGATLQPMVAAQYMFDIIGKDDADGARTKPECPWYE
ncbi:MAG: glycosyltransferase family 4 protein [Massilia sp.]